MPISLDSAKISVDFVYEWTTGNGDAVNVNMRFLHNDDGPVIHIFNGAMEPIELPANMFLEVSEFLVRQNVLKGIASPVSIGSRNVAMPSITRKAKDEVPAPRKLGQRVAPPPEVEAEPVATLTSQEEGAPEDETPEELSADQSAMLAERFSAKAKANLERSKTKRLK